MSFSFNPRQGLVVVGAELEGPSGAAILRFALDTGATSTLVNLAMLVGVGYDPGTAPTRVQVTTGSGIEFAPRVVVIRLRALGQQRRDFPVLGHTLPASAGVDGLIGLDFLRGFKLGMDFQSGEISLA
jgi:predicted aspartyl protease